MKQLTLEHDFLTVLRHVMSHGVVTLLAVVIAFGTPDAARYVLYVWWPRVTLDSNLLLATEIVLASTLLILFSLCRSAWDNFHRLTSANKASLLLTRPTRKGWLSNRHERNLVRSLPAARDASVFAITGFETLVAPDSLLKSVFATAFEVRVMLLNPLGKAVRRRADSLSEEVTVATLHAELSASIAFLNECRKSGKKVSLKFYDHDPFWKIVVLDDSVWVQHCHSGREMKDQPEYVFGLQHAEPNQGLFVPFYTFFLQKWNELDNWEYDFDRSELVQRDAKTGNESRRVSLVLPGDRVTSASMEDGGVLSPAGGCAPKQIVGAGENSEMDSCKFPTKQKLTSL